MGNTFHSARSGSQGCATIKFVQRGLRQLRAHQQWWTLCIPGSSKQSNRRIAPIDQIESAILLPNWRNNPVPPESRDRNRARRAGGDLVEPRQLVGDLPGNYGQRSVLLAQRRYGLRATERRDRNFIRRAGSLGAVVRE
jgi:hypothetical protein